MKKQHSIKVPQLYKIASNIYKKVKEEGASLKNLVYEANHPNKKGIYALVLTTIQNDSNIDLLFKKSEFLTKEPGIQVPLARVLITELLWGKRRLSSECKPIQTILAYEQMFQAHCSDLIADDSQPIQIEKVPKPRFVRVNTLKLAVNEAVDAFRDEGWMLKRFLGNTYGDFLEEVNTLTEYEFMVDMHVKELLIFPPRTQFYKHVAYKCGEIILQDKASCLPATLLNPPPGSYVLDMCAAPGMKTTQLAALLENLGKVYAVEKDAKRMVTLKSMVESAGVSCVETIFKDVLTVDFTTLPDVEYILVDPSCSGTGIVDRIDIDNAPTSQDRINKLSGFQIMILKHAMRAFPKAKRIVYSTCSLLPEENEAVVNEVISNNSQFKLLNCKNILPQWDNFGSDKYEVGTYCIYSRPEHDFTNGFFVAIFERLQEGETNEFLKKGAKIKNQMLMLEEYNEQEEVLECNYGPDTQNNDSPYGNDMNTEQMNKKLQTKKKSDKIEDGYQSEELNVSQNDDDVIIKKQKKKKKQKEKGEGNKVVPQDIEHLDTSQRRKKKLSKESKLQVQEEKKGEDAAIPKKKTKKSKRRSEILLEDCQTLENESSKRKPNRSRNSQQPLDESTGIASENISEALVGSSSLVIKDKSKKRKGKQA